MNRIEDFKREKDGLDVLPEIERYSREGPDAISERDKALMKWYGVFFRKHTPGFFMMRIRITNGIATAQQVHTLAEITQELGAGFADITTRQQVQLRSVRIDNIPAVFARLEAVGLTSLQTGMDNVRNVIGCPVAGLAPRELFDASPAAREFTRLFRDQGPREARNRSRFAFLVDDWGVARVRAAVEETCGRSLEPAGEDARGPERTDHIGVYRQKDGRSFVGLVVPGGRVTGAQLAEVARLAETYGSGEVRFTTEQNLVIPNVNDPALRELTQEPLLKELPYDPPEILRGLVVCTGIDFCDLALIDTKARALPMTRALAARLPDRKEALRIHWSGCPAGCGNHQLADIGFEGTKVRVNNQVVEAVDVWVGGRSGPEPRPGQRIMENVPLSDLPEVLEYLARFFPKQRVARARTQ